MSMRNTFLTIGKLLYEDKELLRLLHYPPENKGKGIKNPLDPLLKDIEQFDYDWKIRDELIVTKYKDDDLVEKAICRINVYPGQRISTGHNYTLASQDLIVDVFCHSNFDKDLRLLGISDRLNDILIGNRIAGVTKFKYERGGRLEAPNGYTGYRHFYSFEASKK
ncbi:hypothetical protein ABFV99_00595 [Cytobacillus horneckiae]|uniref:hypothetical protein n=1 Tax=Cytobacillus horneckiae TaxID=549687 RepID=UPI0034CDEE76